MTLNYLWVSFFLAALVAAVWQVFFGQGAGVFQEIINSTFSMAKLGFELSLGLTGVMALWLGIMKIGEEGGAVQVLARLVGPFFRRLMPELPKDHPVFGSILMNFSANMLGLDNAATPLGLKAMKELQELNPEKEKASNPQITFLVLNTSGLTLIPISVMVYRAEMGAANPADIFLPILLATSCSTLAGILVLAAWHKIKVFEPVFLAYLLGFIGFLGGMTYYFGTLSQADLQAQAAVVSNFLLFGLICTFILMAVRKKVNVYATFIEGAKEGFQVAVQIIPYLIAMLIAIGVLRTSGAMDLLMQGLGAVVSLFGGNTDFVPALPTALMKPLSGSGARALMIDTMETYGVDSFVGRLACTFQGATDTTFYVLALYFGAVKIKNIRHAAAAGLLADLAGAVSAVFIAYWFFG